MPEAPSVPKHNIAETRSAPARLNDRFRPGALEPIAYWAARWEVNPLTVIVAIHRVGPLLRDVAVEVWRTV